MYQAHKGAEIWKDNHAICYASTLWEEFANYAQNWKEYLHRPRDNIQHQVRACASPSETPNTLVEPTMKIRFNEHPPLSLLYSFPSAPLQLQKYRIDNWIWRSTSVLHSMVVPSLWKWESRG